MTDLLRSDFHYHFQSILELLWKKKSEEEHFVKAVSPKLLVLLVGSFNCNGILAHWHQFAFPKLLRNPSPTKIFEDET